MQKLFKNNITKKVIMAILLVVILFNFICPTYSHAEIDGGVLLDPIKMFISFLGDITMSAVNSFFTGVWIGASDAKAVPDTGADEDNWAQNIGAEIDWPTILISPQEIFAGKVLALNVNFLRDPEYANSSDGSTPFEQAQPADDNANDPNFRNALLSSDQTRNYWNSGLSSFT